MQVNTAVIPVEELEVFSEMLGRVNAVTDYINEMPEQVTIEGIINLLGIRSDGYKRYKINLRLEDSIKIRKVDNITFAEY